MMKPIGMPEFMQSAHQIDYKRDDAIIIEGRINHQLHYIMHGVAYVVMTDDQGREVIIHVLEQGDFIGEVYLFNPSFKCHYSVIAHTAISTRALYYSTINALPAEQYRDIATRLNQYIASKIQFSHQRQLALSYQDVEFQLKQVLAELCKNKPKHHHGLVQLTITRIDLAKMVGCTREMTGRMVKQLNKIGVLTYARGKTMIVDTTKV